MVTNVLLGNTISARALKREKKILMDGSNLEQLMLDAGFVDVKSKMIKIEIGDWGSASSKF